MTLTDHLSLCYRHAKRGGMDPAPACAAEISRAEIEAKMREIEPTLQRDHIGKVWSDFLRRVLDLPTPNA